MITSQYQRATEFRPLCVVWHALPPAPPSRPLSLNITVRPLTPPPHQVPLRPPAPLLSQTSSTFPSHPGRVHHTSQGVLATRFSSVFSLTHCTALQCTALLVDSVSSGLSVIYPCWVLRKLFIGFPELFIKLSTSLIWLPLHSLKRKKNNVNLTREESKVKITLQTKFFWILSVYLQLWMF